MHDGEALLRSILEAPDDDGPRLVYADWLEENGQPERAEAIRLAVRSARAECYFVAMGDCVSPCAEWYKLPGLRERPQRWCRRCIDAERAENLCHSNEANWLAPWPLWEIGFQANSTWVPGAEWEWSRGFVAAVSLPAADFLRHAANLFAAHPVAEVRLVDREPWSDSRGWGWADEGATSADPAVSRHLIPPALWKLIPEKARRPVGSPWGVPPWIVWKWFPTAAAAHAALSRACVRRGRGLAGLNPAAGARV